MGEGGGLGRRPAGRVSLLALCLIGAGSLSACSSGPSDAVTTLDGAAGVTVRTAAGATHPGVDGERLAVGDTVATGATTAALRTGGRVTTLAAHTQLLVAARSRYVLGAGTLVVDRHHGAGVTVVAGPVTIDRVGHTSVRIERGFAVRVAVYDGGGVEVSASERSVTVPALHELDAPGASLPTAPTPLALRDDALDRVASPALVAVDLALVQRCAGLDSPAAASAEAAVRTAVAAVVPAAAVSIADDARPLSERLLPVAIARAAVGGGGTSGVDGSYRSAEGLRAAGGSWGVVAALTGAPLPAVQQQISDLLDAGSGGTGSTTTTAGGRTGPTAVAGSGSVARGGAAGAASTGGTSGAGTGAGSPGSAGTTTSTSTAAPSGGGSGAGGGTPTPTSGSGSGSGAGSGSGSGSGAGGGSPRPVPQPTSIGGLVGTVLGLLAPTPTASPAPTKPGLVGGLG